MIKKKKEKMIKEMFTHLYDEVVDYYWKKGSRQSQLHADVFWTMQAFENIAQGASVKNDRWGKTAKRFATHFKEELKWYKMCVKLNIPL